MITTMYSKFCPAASTLYIFCISSPGSELTEVKTDRQSPQRLFYQRNPHLGWQSEEAPPAKQGLCAQFKGLTHRNKTLKSSIFIHFFRYSVKIIFIFSVVTGCGAFRYCILLCILILKKNDAQ